MASKILIIDDDADSIDVMSQLLDAYLPEAEVSDAAEARAGIEQACGQVPDLVLLDVKLPDLSGFEVCRQLKADPRTADTPVLLMSGVMIDTRHRVRGLNVGADGYLCKPFEPPEFIAQVRSLLRLHQSTQALRGREKTLESELEARAGALRESEEKYRTLVEFLPFAVVIVQERKVVFANRATAALFGLRSPAEMIDQDPIRYVVAGERRRIAEAMRARFGGDDTVPRQYEATLLRADGSEFPAEQYIARIAYRGAPAEQIIAIDITARKEAEQALMHSAEQLRQAQKMEALGRLSGGVAHDFNNLLTSILGYGRILADAVKKDPDLATDTCEIIHAAERAEELTRQLLAFGHKQISEIMPLDLNEVVVEMDRLLRRTLGEDIELVTLLGEGLGTIEADAGQLEQVIMNLAVNARDAMDAGGKLIVQTARRTLDEEFCRSRAGLEAGDYVVLEVIDNGCGMTAEVLSRAFEPFFTTKKKGKGTGLGLSTVYGILQQCGAYLELDSVPGRGTRAWLCFPAVSAKPEKFRSPEAVDVPKGRETVLVIEDDASVRRLTARLLSSLGYRPLEAGNAGEAMMLFEEHPGPVDLVLTDMVMPHMGGVEIVHRLRKNGRRFKTLYMTGFSQEAFVRRGEEDRRTPILLKPYTREMLALKVRRALDA